MLHDGLGVCDTAALGLSLGLTFSRLFPQARKFSLVGLFLGQPIQRRLERSHCGLLRGLDLIGALAQRIGIDGGVPDLHAALTHRLSGVLQRNRRLGLEKSDQPVGFVIPFLLGALPFGKRRGVPRR